MNRQTFLAKNNEVPRQWLQVDATDQILGRLATQIATILMGKHKPEYTPHHDVGDFVVVTNADKIRLTGRKLDQKHLKRYTGYPSGLKLTSYRDQMEKAPEKLISEAVRRMLPKNKLARHQLTKLKVYRGGEHPHAAQSPEVVELTTR
ncbi:50S ribosomal protein L13 [Mucisphaera sp.]|uniref:50S ribosomal protein L13 n=1 Tax=Mucisphaera sp. TaxID=2913024 RepID=UPI003D0E8574